MNATVLTTLVYGCEVWNLAKQQESRVQGTQMRVLRRIDGVSRVDRVRNEDTYKAGLGGYSRRSKVKTGEVEEQDNKESF